MHHSTILKALSLLAVTVASLPTGGNAFGLEAREQDADEAIAYAWFDEEDDTVERSVQSEVDADESIAYAWFDKEDDEMKRRSVESEIDADEAIAYAWFDEEYE